MTHKMSPALEKYWQESASESVLDDYRSGNVLTIPDFLKRKPETPAQAEKRRAKYRKHKHEDTSGLTVVVPGTH